jgi:hypothetical protein
MTSRENDSYPLPMERAIIRNFKFIGKIC